MKSLSLIQNKKLPLIIGSSLVFALTACQPPSDKATSSEAQSTTIQSTQPVAEAKTPKELTKALVELSEETLKERLICSKLNDTINEIDNKNEIEDIHAVQHQLTACLPVANNAEILEWLAEYQAMYTRFLSVDSDIDNSAFYDLMSSIEQGKKVSVTQLKAVNPHVRYLVSLIMSRSDVSVRYLGEGDYEFHHDLTAMADTFSPYLPEDQAAFVQRMAQDNQGIFWFDAAIAFSFEELVERTVFWEDFMHHYPQSIFYNDANVLFNSYRYLLFFGSENTQWTDEEMREFYDLDNEQLMVQLTQRSDSKLAKNVQNFLIFMDQSDTERLKRYPIPDKDENGREIDERNITPYQLHKALDLSSPWTDTQNRNCLNGIICVDDNAQ
ncbi:hypothetical protein IPZ60_01285 [Psychrobacter sp. NG25]|uniref:hypothetical protein n=1 Tax=Psychrobacter sp. NG25 TaxID=2782005 RepID=UPI001883BD02|nr:hypothetical protein [Psychrobacter sp. NG25]MBF0657369.1 hypothetical protein [Psychrobacter sp. NG25]